MARIRYIKPGFFESEELAECEPMARLLFAGLWCWADRDGRLEDRPKRLKAQIFSYDNCDVDDLLNQLQQQGFIHRYEVDGVRYIQVQGFVKHQKVHHREPESTYPPALEPLPSPYLAPTLPLPSPYLAPTLPLPSRPGNGEWVMGNGNGELEGGTGETAAPPPEDRSVSNAREICKTLGIGSDDKDLKREVLALCKDHPQIAVPSLAWSVRNHYGGSWHRWKPKQCLQKFRQWVTSDEAKIETAVRAASQPVNQEPPEIDYSDKIIRFTDEQRADWERRNRELTLAPRQQQPPSEGESDDAPGHRRGAGRVG